MANDVTLTIGAKDRTAAALKSVRKGLNAVGRQASIAGLVGVAGMAKLVSSSAATADEVGKLSDRFNISTESIAAFARQADLTGTSSATVNKALEKMSKNIGDAAAGFGMAMPMFKAMNINIDEFKKLGAEEQYLKIAESISQLGSEAEQASAASAFFGRSGVTMLNMIREGEAGFKAAKEEVLEYGIALNRLEVKQIENMNDEITRAKGALEGVGMQLTKGLSPFIRQMAIDFQNSAKQGKGFGSTMETVINNMIKGVAFVADAWRGVSVVVKGFEVLFAGIAQGIIENLFMIVDGWRMLANIIPGIDLEPMTGFESIMTAARDRTAELQNELTALVEKEMPADNIIEWAEQAKIAALEAADATSKVVKAGTEELSVTQEKEQKKQEASLKKHNDIMLKMKKGLQSQALGLLKLMIGDSKAGAIAIIAIEKGLAIAETIINTEAAAMAAAKHAAAWGGQAAAAAAYGQVKAMGAISVGLIAATGLMEAGAVSGGGGGGAPSGSASDPLTTQDAIPDVIVPSVSERQPVNLSISAGLYDQTALVDLAESLSELAGDGLDVRATVV